MEIECFTMQVGKPYLDKFAESFTKKGAAHPTKTHALEQQTANGHQGPNPSSDSGQQAYYQSYQSDPSPYVPPSHTDSSSNYYPEKSSYNQPTRVSSASAQVVPSSNSYPPQNGHSSGQYEPHNSDYPAPNYPAPPPHNNYPPESSYAHSSESAYASGGGNMPHAYSPQSDYRTTQPYTAASGTMPRHSSDGHEDASVHSYPVQSNNQYSSSEAQASAYFSRHQPPDQYYQPQSQSYP